MGFEDHESMETKKIHLRTHHGVDFEVNLYNAEMCGFDEGILVTMDLGDPTIEQDNMDIWVLVDTLPILPLCELLKHSY